MLELLNQLDGFDSRGDVKVTTINKCVDIAQRCIDILLMCVFAQRDATQVIMATNKIESLDTALIRPGQFLACKDYKFSNSLNLGRIDRKIEFPLPNEKTKRRIFNIHTGRMTLVRFSCYHCKLLGSYRTQADDVNLEEFVMSKDNLSGADIKVY